MGRAVVCRPRRKRKRGLRLVADRVRAATHRRSSGCTSARTARTRTGTVHARVRDPGARRAQGRGRYTDSGAAAGPGAAEPDARDRGGARACANWRVRRRRPTHDAADGAGPRSQRAPGGGHGTRGAAGARVVAVGAGHADRRLAVAAGGPAALADAYRAGLGDGDYSARAAALTALAQFGAADAAETLKTALADKDWAVRLAAARLSDKVEGAGGTRALAIRPAPGTPIVPYETPDLIAPSYSPHAF